MVERLRPIALALDTCQSDSSSLADATHAWIKLSRTEELQSKKQKVLFRMGQALTDEHYVAYALHPKYQGELLDVDDREIVHQWLLKNNPEFISTLFSFQAKSKPFLDTFFTKLASELDPVHGGEQQGLMGFHKILLIMLYNCWMPLVHQLPLKE